MSSMVPPLIVYSTSNVPWLPASTSKLVVVSIASDFRCKSKFVSEIFPSPYDDSYQIISLFIP